MIEVEAPQKNEETGQCKGRQKVTGSDKVYGRLVRGQIKDREGGRSKNEVTE